MFSGITQGCFPVVAITHCPSLLRYTVRLSEALCHHVQIGCSISINGICQSVVHQDHNDITFEAIPETLACTTLSTLRIGDQVSVERSVKVGDEIGGHEVSGHIHGMGCIHARLSHDQSLTLIIQSPMDWMPYLFTKGFIAIDGTSLTLGHIDKSHGRFEVHLIPETLRQTLLGSKQIGEHVNIELDQRTRIIVDTTIAITKQILDNP